MRSHGIPISAQYVDPPVRERFPLPPAMRALVSERDGRRCRLCLRGKPIEIHHIDGHGSMSDTPNHSAGNLVTLCRRCHRFVHAERLVITNALLARADAVRSGEEDLVARPQYDRHGHQLVGDALPKYSNHVLRPDVAFFVNNPDEDCLADCACGEGAVDRRLRPFATRPNRYR